jgi:hypothetical protein
VRDGEWWKQFAVKSTAFSTLVGPAECSPGDCQSKTPRRCLRCLGVHFARVVRDARNVDGIRIQHTSKRLLSACWQQCGVIGDSSASWNSAVHSSGRVFGNRGTRLTCRLSRLLILTHPARVVAEIARHDSLLRTQLKL